MTRRCLIVTSDLMGYSQLAGLVRHAGLEPKQVRDHKDLQATTDLHAVIVDLMDPHGGPDAVAAATHLGVPVYAVGPHVRQDLFEAARTNGARRVLPHSAVATQLVPLLTAADPDPGGQS